MRKYGFVVLNYNNYWDTIECVESLIKIPGDNYSIIIVDNCSENNSLKILKDHFMNNIIVKVIFTQKNVGFSKGNNAGINYLMKEGVKNIFISQNDTILQSLNILDKIESLNLDGIGIVGPQIKTIANKNENPHIIRPDLLYFVNVFLFSELSYLRKNLYRFFPKIEEKRAQWVETKKIELAENINKNKTRDVYALHGSFFFLTPGFMKKIGRINEKVFLFGEEDILAWECEEVGLKRIFFPDVKIVHKKSKSLNLVSKGEKEKDFIKFKIQSQIYIKKLINPIKLLKLILS
jgi:GT2 family glycosyltransferase